MTTRFALVVALLSASACLAADTVDLLAPPCRWTASVDKDATTIGMAPTPEARLAGTVTADGGTEDYPKFRLQFGQPQDLSRFTRLRLKLRVRSENPAESRQLAVVFYDDKKRHEEMEGNPPWQQIVSHYPPVGEWLDFTDWITGFERTAVLMIDFYVYEMPSDPGQKTEWEFAQVQLEGVGDTGLFFDTEIYSARSLRSVRPRGVAGMIGTGRGPRLVLDRSGAVTEVRDHAGRVVSKVGKAPTGLLVRDATTQDLPVAVGGTVTRQGEDLVQEATLEKLGLGIEATYRDVGPYLEVSGKVRDLRQADRAVTVYLALPVSGDGWQWHDSVSVTRTEAGPLGELAYLEEGMNFGLNGRHSKYPIGSISLPGKAGMTLGVRMDEPVVHRIAYNQKLGVFYLAMDFGLVPEKTVEGNPLSEAAFRVLVYDHDPRWGFRSALQRYYDMFPTFFTQRVKEQGGWYVWGDMRSTEGALEAGFRMHWGGLETSVGWDAANGVTPLLYIEPELYQQTHGDLDRMPTREEAMTRLRKLAAGDQEELARFEKLGYAHSYVPGRWVKAHSPREGMQVVAQAALSSGIYDRGEVPAGGPGKYPWMTESQLGWMFPCNLDPEIPYGKGWFARNVYIESGLQGALDSGTAYGGIGLDSFGGFGNLTRANYRREHFRYTDVPLTFSAVEHVPVLADPFCSVEFARDLARDMHARGLVLMANCSWGVTPGWLTFAAPYLDVFGAEAPQFVDADFIRAIARTKLCTDLPYEPVPDWQLQRNQLHGIFPGHGNRPEYMARFAQTFRDLATTGWEPMTHAQAAPTRVRVERYGHYLVAHNPAQEPVTARIAVDRRALGLAEVTAVQVPTGTPVKAQGDALTVELEGLGTVVLKLQ